MKESDSYQKTVEWSEADQCYVGSVPGSLGACCHGDNEEEVFTQLDAVIEEWIEILKKDGRPYEQVLRKISESSLC